MRVLLVEDNELVRVPLEFALTAEGHVCRAVAGFSHAETLVTEDGWDALISNVRLLGRGSGMRLAELALELSIPCLLIAGGPEDIETLAKAGVPYLAQPFPLAEVLEWLRDVAG